VVGAEEGDRTNVVVKPKTELTGPKVAMNAGRRRCIAGSED